MSRLQSIRAYFRQPAARWGKMFLLSGVVGVLSGLAAAGLEFGLHRGQDMLIGQFTHVAGAGVLHFNWKILLLPALGCLIGGWVVSVCCPHDKAHGTNQLISAFHHNRGHLPLPDPGLKATAAVGVISAGGSAGPEGPIAAVGAAIGSTMARLLSLSPQHRRMMLVAGCAGGVGAIFRCPLGGALFATSVLYREPEFEADSMVPALVASVVSYSTFMSFWGYGHFLIQGASRLAFTSAIELIPYAVLGVLCGLLGILLYFSLKSTEFVVQHPMVRRRRLLRWMAPGIGGLGVGALACLLPQIMDARYAFLQGVMDGELFLTPAGVERPVWAWAVLLGLIALVKCVASGLTVGSVGAGGLLGPSVFIGGAAGAFLGFALEAIYPGTFPVGLRQSLLAVGMAGVLSAAMRTPLAAIVMVTEMTGSYGLIVPLMLVCVTSYVICRRWGLNTAQVRSAAESPAHAGDTLVHMLESRRVADLMRREWPYTISPATTLGQMVSGMQSGSRPVFAVVAFDTPQPPSAAAALRPEGVAPRGESRVAASADATAQPRRLVGMVSISDISRIMAEPAISDIVIAADMMSTDLTVVHPDQDLYSVMDDFRRSNHEVLPVVPDDGSRRFLGMLSRQDIHEAVRTRVEELRDHAHREHAGIAAIEQDEQLHQLYQLLMGVSSPRPDTIQRMPVPLEAIGKSLREADFRRQHGAQVIGIQNADGLLQCPPDIDAPLRSDQRLLVILGRGMEPEGRQSEAGK